MPPPSSRPVRWLIVKRLILPTLALLLALLYIFALHPRTGFFGGFIYLLLGWAIPSAINLLLSAWVALLFKVRWAYRAGIFVAVSFLLGMNTLLPDLFKARPDPASSFEISRVIKITPGKRVDEGMMTARLPDEIFYTRAPTALGVSVGGNEGCMCMWFTDAGGPSTEGQVWDVINKKVHRSGIAGPLYTLPQDPAMDRAMRKMAVGGAHFDVRFTRSENPGKTVDLLLTIYDGWDVTAVFKQTDIPISSAPLAKGNAPGLRVGRFYQNALSMLVRHNFWVFLLDAHMAGFPKEPLRKFLDRAVVVQ